MMKKLAGRNRAARKQKAKQIRMSVAAILSAVAVSVVGIGAGANHSVVEAEAASTQWTEEYPFLTLIESSLLNSYTDETGIYEQLMLGIKYRTMDEMDILQLYNAGYRIPVESVERLYIEGWISSFLYKTIAELPYTAEDFADVYDMTYYVTQNPAISNAVEQGTLSLDEDTVFYNYLYCGIPAGLSGNDEFSFDYFESNYEDVVEDLGGDRLMEVAYYILNSDTIKGNA